MSSCSPETKHVTNGSRLATARNLDCCLAYASVNALTDREDEVPLVLRVVLSAEIGVAGTAGEANHQHDSE